MQVEVLPGAPLFGWDYDSVRNYVNTCGLKVGDSMVIYSTENGVSNYRLARIVRMDQTKEFRIVLDRNGPIGGRAFYQTGKNCRAPNSGTRMLPPNSELAEHLTFGNHVSMVTQFEGA